MFGHSTRRNPGNGYPSWVAFAIFLVAASMLLNSCKKNEYPKPKAYPRIDYPRAQYQSSELTTPPISFEYPTYTSLEVVQSKKKNWINLHFVRFHATLHTSYIETPVEKAVQMIHAREKIAFEQAPLASEVRKEEFEATDKSFIGYFYLTDGNTPSPVQFILTNHNGLLFDGSLVFDCPVNRDSLASVVDGLTRDIRHLVETFQFKK